MSPNQFEFRERKKFIPHKKETPKTNNIEQVQNTIREKIFHTINKEEVYNKLSSTLSEISRETNQSLGEDFVDEDARVKMKGYQGIPKYERLSDLSEIEKLEELWAEESIDRQEFIREKKLQGVDQKEVNKKMKEEFKKRKNTDRGNLLEMAITTIFYKILKEKFLVVRTSLYDDYKRGADNLIVDKETGNPICAFDEVYDFESGNRYQDKMQKLQEKTKRGGTEIKYGATFQNGKLEKKTLLQVPTFYLGVNPDELNGLLQNMDYDPSRSPTRKELEIFDKLIASLEKQVGIMEQLTAFSQAERDYKKLELKKKFYRNLQKFKLSLQTIKKIRKGLQE